MSVRPVTEHFLSGEVIAPVFLHDLLRCHLAPTGIRCKGFMRGRFALGVSSGPVADGGEVVLVALAAAVHVRAQTVDALLPICGELGLELREVGVRQFDVAIPPIGALLLGSSLRRGGRISIGTCSLFTFSIRICFFSI